MFLLSIYFFFITHVWKGFSYFESRFLSGKRDKKYKKKGPPFMKMRHGCVYEEIINYATKLFSGFGLYNIRTVRKKKTWYYAATLMTKKIM